MKFDFDDLEQRLNEFVSYFSINLEKIDRYFDTLISNCQNLIPEEKLFYLFLTTHFDSPETAKDFYQKLNWKILQQSNKNRIREILDEFFNDEDIIRLLNSEIPESEIENLKQSIMKDKKPKVIPKSKWVEGITLSLENAKRYFEDSKILFNDGSYGHALTSIMIAIEECGKALLMSYGFMDMFSEKTVVNRFYSHEAKMSLAAHLLVAVFRDLSSQIEEASSEQMKNMNTELIKSLVIFTISIPVQIKKLREFGLYMDFDEDKNSWTSPLDVQKEDVESLIPIMELFFKKVKKRIQYFQTKLEIPKEKLIELKNILKKKYYRELDRFRKSSALSENSYEATKRIIDLLMSHFIKRL